MRLGEESRHDGDEGDDEGVRNIVLQAGAIGRSCLLLSGDKVRVLGETSEWYWARLMLPKVLPALID